MNNDIVFSLEDIEYYYRNIYNYLLYNRELYIMDISKNMHYTDNVTIIKCFDSINHHDISYNTKFYRSLANHDIRKNVNYQSHRGNRSDVKMNKKIKDCKIDRSTYECLLNGQKDFESYKKNYKQRYTKKKGLAKTDCYLEKKVFDKFEYIDNITGKMTNKRNAYRKIIFNKYTMRLILFALLPSLGIIFPILFSAENREGRLVRWTNRICPTYYVGQSTGEQCVLCRDGYYHLFTAKGSYSISYFFNALITTILLIAACFMVFYTLVKVIKYVRIKSGKGKMNAKGYFNFCKEMLENKKYQ
ncbi:hypothetical protein PVIIG_05306 [Plasmodium vivax India VII]|uniref:Variable surface protein n=2 Tax=Plasmodium vivax TaxID=5855 RepID=A0A0J9TKS9_PLAVI|nr:hypothetical protein PVIIG_05306 [Plasmodium vivax India VII]KMZ95711.1 hypothetical protein PVMG_05311 [Plasmodium vivax Mauritania I]